jgi:outer membrane protein assembly factor BamB
MLPQRRRKPVHPDSGPGYLYELQPAQPAAPPPLPPAQAAPDRTAEILTISVITALLVLLGIGIIFWTLENRPASAPTPTPTATPAAATLTPELSLAPSIPAPTERPPVTQPALPQINGTPTPAAESVPAPPAGATPDVRLPIVSLDRGTEETAEPLPTAAVDESPAPAASPTELIIALPFVSSDEATAIPPTPTSPIVELTEIAPTATQEPAAPPTATPAPFPSPTPYLIDSLRAIVDRQSMQLYVGPSSIYTATGSLGVDSEIRLYGRDATGEWVYACCVDNELAWARQADVRIEGNQLPSDLDDDENANDVRWLRFEPTLSTLRPLPAPTPIPEGDFPLFRFTPDNRGRIQPLPNLSAAAKPWITEPQAGGSLVSPVVVAGSSAIVASSDGHLYSFDRVNGNQRWRTNLGQLITVSPAVDNSLIYVADDNGVVRALRDLGNATDELWSRSLGAPPISGINIFSRTLFINLSQRITLIDAEDGDLLFELNLPVDPQPPAIGGQLLYVAAGAVRAYDLMALIEERRIDLVWEEPNIANISAAPVYSTPGVKSLAELYVAGGNNRLYSLDANTGKELWNQDNGETILNMAVNDAMIFVTGNGYIRARSRVDGAEIWSRGIAGQVLGGPYVDDRRLVAYLQNGSFLYLDAASGEALASLAAYPAAASAGAAISPPYVFGPGNDGKLYSFREAP